MEAAFRVPTSLSLSIDRPAESDLQHNALDLAVFEHSIRTRFEPGSSGGFFRSSERNAVLEFGVGLAEDRSTSDF